MSGGERDETAWALAYLRGRANAFHRGTLTLSNLVGAVHVALRSSASVEDVRSVLLGFGLDWDPDQNALRNDA